MKKEADTARRKEVEVFGYDKMKSEIIGLENVWKTYKMGEVEVNALRGVSLAVNHGDFVAITGASGSGKSTMMNLVGCLDLPTKGAIYLERKDISQLNESELAQIRGKKIGFIFQQFHLISTLSALENVMLPLEFQDTQTDEAKEKAKSILEMVGLSDRIYHLPSQLSGGQQQRVAIGRSLANNPDVILADEPTGNLDSKTGADVVDILQKLWKEEGKTIIMVTHDLKLASHAKRIVQLKDGQIVKGG